MKPKISALLFLLFAFVGVSCQTETEVLSKEELIGKLVEDKDFIEHVKLINESKKNIISGKVDMSKIDQNKINSNSPEEVYNVIKNSDTEKGEIIADNIKKRTDLMVKVINKYPQLSSINQEELVGIFETAMKTVSKNLNEDFSSEIQKRLENDKRKN